MSQIQFDTINAGAGCTSGANSRCAGSENGGGSFQAYLDKAQSTSTAPAKNSDSASRDSAAQSTHNTTAQDAQPETTQPSGTEAATSASGDPRSTTKDRDKHDATTRDANTAQAQTQAGSSLPATLPAQQPLAAQLGTAGVATVTPSATQAGDSSSNPDAATTANSSAKSTTPPGPISNVQTGAASGTQPGQTADAQAASAAAVNRFDADAPADTGTASPVARTVNARNSDNATATQGSPQTPNPLSQGRSRSTNLPADATTADVKAGTASDVQAEVSAQAQPGQSAATAAQVPSEQAAQANAAATGSPPPGSATGAARKKNATDRAADNAVSAAGPAVNADAVAVAQVPNTAATAASEPTATDPSKDKHAASDTTVNGTAAASDVRAAPTRSDQTSSTTAGQQSGSVGQTDQTRFLQRVTAAFQSMGDRGGSVRIMLHPPELGSLRLEVSVQNGALSAHLQAETPAARNLLLDNLPALRDRLAGQNVKIDHFDVDLMDRQPQGGTSGQTFSQSNGNSQGSSGGNSSARSARNAVGSVTAATAAPTAAASAVVETTRLNVVV